MSRKASVFFILVLSFPIMRTFHNNLNWNDNINETLGEHTNKGHSLNIKNQPTNSYTKYCELVGFFVSLGIPPKIRFDGQNGGNIQTNKIWQR